MNMTIGVVVNLYEKMSHFMDNTKEIPSNIKYRMSRLLLKLGAEVETYSKTRNELIEKFGSKGEDGRIGIKPESPEFELFTKEHETILSENVEINGVRPFKLSEVYSFTPASLTQLFSYVGLLEDDDEETAEKLSA